MKHPGDVEAFALEAIERLGGATEQRSPGLYTVLWPEAGDGAVETRQLAFDPEAMEDDPDAELLTFASPALERLIERATASGRLARAYLAASAAPSRALAERLPRAFRFVDASWTPGTGRAWWFPAGVFLFRASYLSDVREEEMHEIAVGLPDRRILRRLTEAVERLGLVPEPPDASPMMAEAPAAAAYGVARGELERRLVSPLGVRRRELAARLARESGRAASYYDELAREVEEQLRALPPGSPERAPLDAKLHAIALERDGRLAELRQKYALTAEVSLLSVLRLYLPRLVFHGTLAGKRSAADLDLTWDPVDQVGEPIRCPHCSALVYEAGLDRSGTVVCVRCLDAPPRSPARR